jgi:aryl-alcohol dehydrogenase-like predicted oxidoreductase
VPRSALGASGLTVTPIGLGLAALGRPAYITLRREEDLGEARDVDTMEWRCHQMLDAAFDLGIRYVDAARSYGNAEAYLASWLKSRAVSPGQIIIGSKWGYRYTGDWRLDAPTQEVKDQSLAMFKNQWGETQALLGDHLSLYQIHSATLESGVLEDRAVLEALAGLRHRGVAVGLSVSGPRQAAVVRRALDVEIEGTNPFQSVQATWNILEPSAGSALAEARQAGWGVLVKEVLANGRLTDAEAESLDPVLSEISSGHGATIEMVAIASALDQPWASVVLSGAVTEPQLRTDCAALALDLTASDRQKLRSLAESPSDYWEHRAGLPWH